MKQTTTQIYNIITSSNFEDIKNKLEAKAQQHNWQIPERQEYSFEELIHDLPDCIDLIKQNIEDENFDTLPFASRNQILQTINQIQTTVSNINSGHQQFAQLQDYTQTLKSQIRANRLDFEAKRIPRYREKIKEYQELINKLTELNTILNETESKKEVLDTIVSESENILSQLNSHLEQVKEKDSEIEAKLNDATETYNKINALLATIQEQRDNVVEIMQEAKEAKNNIGEIEGEITSFFSKIEEYREQTAKFTQETEEKINQFKEQTDNIIETNKKQQTEIDNQLQKAVGASLFSTFAQRKKQLNPASWGWLLIIVLSVIGMSLLSYDIISEFTGYINHIGAIKSTIDANSTAVALNSTENLNSDVKWMWVFLKMTLLLPIIFLLSFATSRYGKERRLIEEYAFKSTISLALTPYADLIKKVEEDGADSKYRDFLIASIENIFSVPTDRAFGTDKNSRKKSDENSIELVEKVVNMLAKIKESSK